MATLRQMQCRLLSGHVMVLKAVRDGRQLDRPGMFPSELRGLRKCYSTLVRWGAISDGELTDTGRDLLKGGVK